MPYTSNNWGLFSICSNGRWWKTRQVSELVRRLNRVDFSVVASRRDGLAALNDFDEAGIYGESLFGTDKQFPNEMADNYLTTAHGLLSGVLNDLQGALSWRETNKAKDTEATQGGSSRGRDVVSEKLDQGCQDQTKAFYELRKILGSLENDREQVFRRQSFELRTSSTWGAAAAAGAGLPDDSGDEE